MADYDVEAVGLASPPAEPYQQNYTPGILVRNNGIASAVATGYLQLYDKGTGLLIKQWTVESGGIAPGDVGTASADEAHDFSVYDPDTELMLTGYVTTDNDQVPANNPLPPVTVTVQEGESPEPPVVEAHAAQHENGGYDELNVEGLRGKLADDQEPVHHASDHEEGGQDEMSVDGLHGTLADGQPTGEHHTTHQDGGTDELDVTGLKGFLDDAQTPIDHAASHQDGGSDELNVGGLSGELADPQKTKTHATTHQEGGSDELNVGGLDGQLAEPQTPATHAATHQEGGSDELNVGGLSGELADEQWPREHAADKHDVTVEATAHKGAANGYCPLDEGTRVDPNYLADVTGGVDDKFLRGDQTWAVGTMTFAAPTFRKGGDLPVEGVSALGARADHVHGGEGVIDAVYGLTYAIPEAPNPPYCLDLDPFPGGLATNVCFLEIRGLFQLYSEGPTRVVTLHLHGLNTNEDLLQFPLTLVTCEYYHWLEFVAMLRLAIGPARVDILGHTQLLDKCTGTCTHNFEARPYITDPHLEQDQHLNLCFDADIAGAWVIHHIARSRVLLRG